MFFLPSFWTTIGILTRLPTLLIIFCVSYMFSKPIGILSILYLTSLHSFVCVFLNSVHGVKFFAFSVFLANLYCSTCNFSWYFSFMFFSKLVFLCYPWYHSSHNAWSYAIIILWWILTSFLSHGWYHISLSLSNCILNTQSLNCAYHLILHLVTQKMNNFNFITILFHPLS